eukprot:TRINITY_DN455_c0_g1_i1.p1 TRINITY_DN455_c0_g1~~TRINITY_DN455_c0_g1_i1.p1  ORF type:complete len:650 (+),score=228.05 TRINITY_DN455_c0_g1_i1:93-2042(+)
MPGKKKGGPTPSWEWKDDKGKWNGFTPADAEMLEGRYLKDPSAKFATTDFTFNKEHKTVYQLDYGAMTQTNAETGVARAIRRAGIAASPKKAKVDQVWSWKDDDGEWNAYEKADSHVLEEQYLALGPKAKFSTAAFSWNKKHKTLYLVDFGKMSQKNSETGSTRQICRGDPEKAASPKGAAAAAAGKGKHGWQWWAPDGGGSWKNYDPTDAKLLEAAYQSGPPVFLTKDLTFNKGYDSQYLFDFKVMTQCNLDSGTSRKVRRISDSDAAKKSAAKADADGEDDGYAAALAGMDSKEDDSLAGPSAPKFEPSLPPKLIAVQKKFGAQSKRGGQKVDYGPMVSKDPHGRKCFDEMLKLEEEFAAEWVVFYHSYSVAALLYEVQAAVASVLFRFKSQYATLPRLLWKPFGHIPTAKRMLEEFPKWKDRDHNPAFRSVGICGTSSILADDSEAPAKSVFLMGYSVGPLKGLLEKLLQSCGVPTGMVSSLAKKVVSLAQEHGLDACAHGGKPCKSGRAGHFLQMFIRRELCDEYVYPSFPFGVPDKARMKPLGKYLEGDTKIAGQIRITANPDIFLRATCVRMFVYSADPTFHAKRPAFQEKLVAALEPIVGDAAVRTKAARGIFGGKLPAWWKADDQSDLAKMPAHRYKASAL